MSMPKDPVKANKVREKYRELALKRPNAWKNDEINILKKMVIENCTYKEISDVLHRGEGGVRNKAWRLGIESKVKDSGPQNRNFKGDKVGYTGIHMWVRKYKPLSDSCEWCGKSGLKLELHSLDGKYSRDLTKWAYLCISCHRTYDNAKGKNPLLTRRETKYKPVIFLHQKMEAVTADGD